MGMRLERLESVPPTPSPEQPPLAPHDPPEPAPQAAAWKRAIRVVTAAVRENAGRGSVPRP